MLTNEVVHGQNRGSPQGVEEHVTVHVHMVFTISVLCLCQLLQGRTSTSGKICLNQVLVMPITAAISMLNMKA